MPENKKPPRGVKIIDINASLSYTGTKKCLLINHIYSVIRPKDPSMNETAKFIMNIARKNQASFIDKKDGKKKFIILVGNLDNPQTVYERQYITDLFLMYKSIMFKNDTTLSFLKSHCVL